MNPTFRRVSRLLAICLAAMLLGGCCFHDHCGRFAYRICYSPCR